LTAWVEKVLVLIAAWGKPSTGFRDSTGDRCSGVWGGHTEKDVDGIDWV
jgi:hypothetical protein